MTADAFPVGPQFDYGSAPSIFLGRSGEGPLRVVLDTNVLLDYLEYGPGFWEGKPASIEDPDYAAEVDALEVILKLWVIRDIQFHLPEELITDAKRVLAAERQLQRARAVDQFAAALTYTEMGPCYDSDLALRFSLPATVRQAALAAIPEGNDRSIVDAALGLDAHVFLTRDRRVLRTAPTVKPAGLFIASPLDLLEELAACGAILCLMAPQYAYWPIPDLARLPHLIAALGLDE